MLDSDSVAAENACQLDRPHQANLSIVCSPLEGCHKTVRTDASHLRLRLVRRVNWMPVGASSREKYAFSCSHSCLASRDHMVPGENRVTIRWYCEPSMGLGNEDEMHGTEHFVTNPVG